MVVELILAYMIPVRVFVNLNFCFSLLLFFVGFFVVVVVVVVVLFFVCLGVLFVCYCFCFVLFWGFLGGEGQVGEEGRLGVQC